jgi:hypothetical protein
MISANYINQQILPKNRRTNASRSHTVIQRMKKKFQLCRRLLNPFKNTLVSFSPNSPHDK